MTGDGRAASNTDGGWERQVLDTIENALGDSDPKLASLLAMFSRLASSEEMPAREKVRSPRRRAPHRSGRRRSRETALRNGRQPQLRPAGPRAVVLAWLVTSVVLITVALVLSHGGTGSCAQAAAVCGGFA